MKGSWDIFKPSRAALLGAALSVSLGLLLWVMPAGEPWINASFDYQLRFGSRPVTNKIALVLMDNAAFDQFAQQRGQPWDRGLHAQLLNRLADDHCKLVVIDSFFRAAGDPAKDRALADALRRQERVVLMAEQSQITHPTLLGVQPTLPFKDIVEAAGTNWGVAWLDPDLDSAVRRHWPFPSPGPNDSLPWSAATAMGAQPDSVPEERWLRYYGQNGGGLKFSYGLALSQPAGFFRDYVVFIGNQPKTTLPDGEVDEFSTPYTRWTGESTGGAEILSTQFLNLLNNEALLRPAKWIEFIVLLLGGVLLGGTLHRMNWLALGITCVGAFALVPVAAALLSHHTNYWFPWLIISGGQLPCALACALVVRLRPRPSAAAATVADELPDAPGYELIQPAFGAGAYGRVWLARRHGGGWRALKAIYRSSFNHDTAPYDREYEGVEKYMSLSGQHPGLLQVDHVSPKGNEYFYYVMALGDSVNPDWEKTPTLYKPRDLDNELAGLPGGKLPVNECVRLGIELCSALGFIHSRGLTHRDIKPKNIIFVNGEAKLADLGLITHVRLAGHDGTLVGTPGYMPPPPDRPGTVSADIYAMGVVLYVLSTGRSAEQFPEIATTLADQDDPAEFMALNHIILTACEPLPAHRYATAELMRAALERLQK